MSSKASRKFSVTALLLLALLTSVSLIPNNASAATQPKYLTVGWVGEPDTSDGPIFTTEALSALTTQIPYNSYDALGANGQLQNTITTFAVVPGSNWTEWVYNVIPGLKWSDGVPINATDLAYSLGIYMRSGSPWANLSLVAPQGGLSELTGEKILNSSAVEFQMTPDPAFPYQIAVYPVYPYHYFAQFDNGTNSLATTPIWGGPGDSSYVPVDNYTGGTTLELVPNFYSPLWNGSTTAAIARVYIQYFASDSALLNALAAGTVDAAATSYTDIQSLTQYGDLKSISVPSVGLIDAEVRTVGYPWNNTDFRRGLFDLINATAINELVYNDTATYENSAVLVPYATQWMQGLNLQPYSYNVTEANLEFKAAGLHQDSAGNWILPNGTALPTIILQGSNDGTYTIRPTQLVAQWWTADGIPTQATLEPDSVLYGNLYTSYTFTAVVAPNGFAPSPWRYLFNAANWPDGAGALWQNSTFTGDLAEAAGSANLTAGAVYVKQALQTLADAAIIDGIVTTPSFITWNTQSFTYNPQTVVSIGTSNAFTTPDADSAILPTVTPVSASTLSASSTTSTTSTGSASSANTTTGVSSNTSTTSSTGNTIALSTYVVPVIAVAGIIVAGAQLAALSKRRSPHRTSLA